MCLGFQIRKHYHIVQPRLFRQSLWQLSVMLLILFLALSCKKVECPRWVRDELLPQALEFKYLRVLCKWGGAGV